MRQSVLNELSGSIAHELNQPLTAILSNAEAAQELLNAQELDHRKLGEILNDIVVEDTRAADVIGRVRQLLKKGDRKREAINIGRLISSTLALLRGEIVKRKIAVDVDCAPRLPLVLGDAVQLQQVLINLLVNAMDAMTSNPPSEREIRIRAFSEFRSGQNYYFGQRRGAFHGSPRKIVRAVCQHQRARLGAWPIDLCINPQGSFGKDCN